MTTKGKKGQTDAARFEGNGVSYKAKLIGIEDVPEARGDQMCQDALIKLKNAVKQTGEHKKKIMVNVTLDGLRIVDAISLALYQNRKKNESKGIKDDDSELEKEAELAVLHTHAVHRISFISRDTTDNRAFGYVYGEEDGTHKFFAIKTAAAAEQLVFALRDLFQVVYEMKKKEMEEAKERQTSEGEENSKTPGNGSTSGTGQTPQTKVNADTENIYQVPPNNAPVKPESQEEQCANLLELEDQADNILKGIEQIKNLEFDSITSDTMSSPVSPPTSPLAKLAPPPSGGSSAAADPWGVPNTATAPATGSSALGDLAGLQTSPFPTAGPAFGAAATFPMQQGFGSNFAAGLPITRDPFANDPFSANAASVPQQRPQVPGGYGAPNPFGGVPFAGQPAGMMPGMAPAASPGMMPPGMVVPGIGVPPQGMVGMSNPFAPPAAGNPSLQNAFVQEPANLLQPVKKDEPNSPGTEEVNKARSKSPRDDLFGDLVGLKKSSPATAKTPKDMFAQLTAAEKKSLNELKTDATNPPPATSAPPQPAQASEAASTDPFGDPSTVISDQRHGLLDTGQGKDPFDTSFIPPSFSEQTNQFSNCVPAPNPATTSAPPVPQRQLTSHDAKDRSAPAVTSLSSSSSTRALPSPPHISSPARSKKNSSDANSLPSLSTLSFSDTPESSTAIFMLPSPDEPPPPLPSHIAMSPSSSHAPAPPPPPPRPSTKSSSSSLSSMSSALSPSVFPSSQNPTNDLALQEKSLTKTNSFNNDVNSETKSSISTPQTSQSNFSVKFDEDPFSPESSNNQTPLFPDKNGADNSERFSITDPFGDGKTDPFSPVLPAREDSDPFIMPFHLTPGFKAVAKFGSDPFDDSFTSAMGGKSEKWDPFGLSKQENDNQNHSDSTSSPFGEPLSATTTQPVNGNASENPLLD